MKPEALKLLANSRVLDRKISFFLSRIITSNARNVVVNHIRRLFVRRVSTRMHNSTTIRSEMFVTVAQQQRQWLKFLKRASCSSYTIATYLFSDD